MSDQSRKKSQQSVLIIDDDQFLLNLYSIKFKNSGFAVDTATGSEAALSKLREGGAPDIILADVVMPGMDGLSFIETLRKEKLAPGATVIVLSNQNQPAEMARANALGIAGYIVKANTVPSEVVAEVTRLDSTRRGKS
ncbi:response regulator [Patescibacteria group bacterium]|nr:response regulator [Patescibacteria group bacterium]